VLDRGSPLKPAFTGWEDGCASVSESCASLSGRISLRFCPACGIRITEFYDRADVPDLEGAGDQILD
jgi:hypothetical protein